MPKPPKLSVLVATAADSRALAAYTATLGLSAELMNRVFVAGPPAAVEALHALFPGRDADADALRPAYLPLTLNYMFRLIGDDPAVRVLSGTREEVSKAAKKLKLPVCTAADFDALPGAPDNPRHADTPVLLADPNAAKLFAKMSARERAARLEWAFWRFKTPVIAKRIAAVGEKVDLNLELVHHIITSDLLIGEELRPLARYEERLRKQSTKSVKSSEPLYLISKPKAYYEAIWRFKALGEPYVSRARDAAREEIRNENVGVDDVYLRAAQDAADPELVIHRAFQLSVWTEHPAFFLSSLRLPGHDELGSCSDCETYQIQEGTRRLLAFARFEALSAETQALIAQFMATKRAAPMLEIVKAWAPTLGVTGPKPRAPKKGPTPALDRAEAWFARVKKATTPAQLKKLTAELDKLDLDAMILEDAERWKELLNDVADHRGQFANKPVQQRLIQDMLDALSST